MIFALTATGTHIGTRAVAGIPGNAIFHMGAVKAPQAAGVGFKGMNLLFVDGMQLFSRGKEGSRRNGMGHPKKGREGVGERGRGRGRAGESGYESVNPFSVDDAEVLL